ncbi:MAG: hypothetical protein GC204_16740 [Chloroflexi bacterium]|nr:hypothetical protein [Chloroflexota bacterium]
MLIRHVQSIHRVKYPYLLSLFAVLLTSLSLIVQPVSAQDQNDVGAAQDIIKTINNWRIEQGLWPLRENETLDRMAYDQASYVLSLPKTPEEGAIHIGKYGEMPPARAHLPQYNWPAYGAAQNTAVGEIAYTGFNAVAAQQFWANSPIHKRTALNAAYREIGAAALPQRWGHFYLVDFGSRPDVLPAIADTADHTLYLTNERYAWARSPWILNVLKVRLFDSEGKPLESDWEAWQPQIPLPANAGDSLYVGYLDGNGVMVLAPVPLEGSAAAVVATDTSNPATPTVTATNAATAAATTRATATLQPTATPSATQMAVTATNAATRVPTTAPTAISANGAPNVLLMYDAKSLTLINSTGAPINMSGLVFVGKTSAFAASRWSTQWLSGTLTALAGGDCLQVWSWQEKNTLDKPSRCRQRRSVLTIAPEQLFWKQGDFLVQWGQDTLATCKMNATTCEFALPS